MSPALKHSYVRAVHAVRDLLAAVGLLGLLDRAAQRSSSALWVRSWFAVYDLDDMVRLRVPWWTFEAAARVEDFLGGRPGARVFEWGSGASTVWLGERSASVTSVEHDPAWAERVAAVVPDNADLRLREPAPVDPVAHAEGPRSRKAGYGGLTFAAYVDAIDDVGGELDLIVIDGRARESCLARAVDRLAAGGVIVLDNVERQRYREAIAVHVGARPDLSVHWTRGRTAALPYPTRTALITRRAVA